MSKYILTDGYVIIGGYFVGAGTTYGTVDISNYCFSIDTPRAREQVDVSGFSSTGAKEFLFGQREERITLGMLGDFGANLNFGTQSLDQVLDYLYTNGTQFLIRVQPTSGTTSAENPVYSGTVGLFTHNPLSGQINSRAEINLELVATTSAGIARGTS